MLLIIVVLKKNIRKWKKITLRHYEKLSPKMMIFLPYALNMVSKDQIWPKFVNNEENLDFTARKHRKASNIYVFKKSIYGWWNRNWNV